MCLSPRTVKISSIYLNQYLEVPCGKCLECLKNYQNNWLVRLYYESLEHSKISFVTLTYRDSSIPTVIESSTGEFAHSLCKKHLQNWLKRARRSSEYHGKKISIKYFACGEYG